MLYRLVANKDVSYFSCPNYQNNILSSSTFAFSEREKAAPQKLDGWIVVT